MLSHLQNMLGEIYGVDTPYNIYDFLITDSAVVRALEGEGAGRDIDEKLLICEQEESAEVSLFLSGELLERLRADDPRDGLHSDNLGDFWTALEGISHFLYYMWNAERENPITLMEMELQAEVDKFVTTARLLEAQGVVLPRRLHRWLFELPRFDRNLSEQELDRYHQANRYAAKYCIRIARQLSRRASLDDFSGELRHFYRLSQPGKIQHIDASYDSLP
jgi:hypothetical protein